MYIRLGKNGEPTIHKEGTKCEIGKAIQVTDGNDLILITTSTMLETGKRWVDEWKKENISVTLISMHTMKPFDVATVNDLINRDIPIITLEEHNIIGGLGSAVSEVIAESGKKVKFMRLALPDKFSHYVGGHQFQKEKFNLIKKPSLTW